MVATKKCMQYLVIREGDYKKIARFINGLDTMRVAGRLPRRHAPPTVARLRRKDLTPATCTRGPPKSRVRSRSCA